MKWRRNQSNKNRWTVNHLISKNGNMCGLCNEAIHDRRDMTIDHIIPKSKGGADDIANYQLAHSLCNGKKGNAFDLELQKN